MSEMMVTCPEGVQPGQSIQITTPSGMMQVTVPSGVAAGQQFRVQVGAAAAPPGTVVDAQNNAFAAGAVQGGALGSIGDASNAAKNALGSNVKKSGDGVMVPCSACGAENRTKSMPVCGLNPRQQI